MASDSLLASVNLVFDPRGPALICKTCQYALAVSKSQVTTHLWKKHGILAESRRDVTLLIRSIVIPNPLEIAPRPDESLCHPHLKLFRGYDCVSCQYRSINLDMMTRHVSSCCPDPLPSSRHRRNPDTLYRDVLLQTWVFGTRKYWTVCEAANTNPLRSFSSSTYLESIHERERALVAATEREAMKETGSKEFDLTSLWMERTQWAHVYDGVRRDLLLRISQVERPTCSKSGDFYIGEHHGAQLVSHAADELKIRRLMAALDRALDRCEETMRRTGHPILCWLNTSSRNRFDQRPFMFLGKAATRQRYRRLFQRFIPFLFRAYNMAPDVRLSALGIRLTKKELTELEKVWNDGAWDDDEHEPEIGDGISQGRYDNDLEPESECEEDENDEEEEEEDEKEAEDEEGEEKECSQGEEREQNNETGDGSLEYGYTSQTGDGDDEGSQTSNDPPGTADKIAELVFRLSIFFIAQEFTNGQPSSSPLVYYSGVLGFSGDGSTFRRAKDYTSQLSALIYIQRLLLLEFALPSRAYKYVCLPRRPSRGHFEILNNVRLKCMVLGCLTPLGEFISLRSRGRKLARGDPPSVLAHWSYDKQTLSYGDISISMESFRNFGHALVQRAEALCNSLMFNWLPEVDLASVKDDMGNVTRGYSFLQHPANALSLAYLKLSTRACTAQRDGLLRGDRWDYKAVGDYLKTAENLQRYLAAMMYALCGQAPRATELFSLECCNGQSSQRGIFVYNGFMIYVIRTHKAKRSTNNEFNVARFLPAKPGRLLYYYLVYIRLFVAMLQRETSMHKTPPMGSRLFGLLEEPDIPWPPSRLTDVLVRNSVGFFNKPLNIRLYRQASVCITEMHVKKVAKPFNRYDDQSEDADPHVVFAWQSGHRPRHRELNYGLDGAFPAQLQPALLNLYEWASVEWHQFLHHQSRGSTPYEEYQPPVIPANQISPVALRGRPNTEGNPRVSYETWRSSNIGPWLTRPDDIAGCKFLPPITQKDFVNATGTDANHLTEPLSAVSANCNRYPTSEMSLGQKRKHGVTSVQEDGCLTARKKPQKQGLPCHSMYLYHHEFAPANMGAWQAPHPYQDANVPVWVGEDVTWRETKFENENIAPVPTDRYNIGSGMQLESAEGLLQAQIYDLLIDLGTWNRSTLKGDSTNQDN